MGFFTAPRICLGRGAIEQLSALEARRAFVVVDPWLAAHDRHRRMLEELQKTETTIEVFSQVVIEPTIKSVDAGIEPVRAFGPDWIVAIGGGSTIDTAKGLWIRYARPDLAFEQLTPLVDLQLRPRARFVAVPTTSGSGSDASWACWLKDGKGGLLEIASRELVPDWTLLDPELPTSNPPSVSVQGGAEMLGAALEAFVSSWSNPFTDSLAREAVQQGITQLPRTLRHGDDPEVREPLHYAATLAGLAASNAQLGLAHALAAAVAAAFALPYGRILGVLLPYVVEFNYPAARDKYGTLGGSLGAAAMNGRSVLSDRLRALWDQLGVPRTLEAAGIEVPVFERGIRSCAENARDSPSFGANPRIPSSQDLDLLLRAAYQGTPVAF